MDQLNSEMRAANVHDDHVMPFPEGVEEDFAVEDPAQANFLIRAGPHNLCNALMVKVKQVNHVQNRRTSTNPPKE